MSSAGNGAVQPAPRPWRRRTWFVLFLVVAAVLVVFVGLIVCNLHRQLQPQQLRAARQLWQSQGPRTYLLVYQVRRHAADRDDRYVVTVKHGRVTAVTVNGLTESPERFGYYGMEALFGYLQGFQDLDAKPGQPRTFTRATFHPQDGHVQWYVRRILGGQEGQEILVESLQAQNETKVP